METERPFDIIDHTADVGIVARGATVEELFQNAALGMLSIVVDAASVAVREVREVRTSADDRETLLASFLAEILFLLEVGHFVARDVDVQDVTETEARAIVRGEPIAPHHDFRTEIKAVTHHGLKVEEHDGRWSASVLFDA